MEVENVKRTQDSMFMTIVDYIEYKGDIENLKKYMAKKYKEDEDVQPKLQKSSS